MHKEHAIYFLGCLLFVSTETEAICNVGVVTQVSGQAQMIRNARNFRLGTDMKICIGDRFTTDADSVAKLKLRDGSVITIGKDSEFVITDYHIFKDQPNQAEFELVKGAFRSITGFITQRPHRYEVKTAVATIGIRGTDFWGGFGLTESGLDVIMLEGHGVYVRDAQGQQVELDTPGLGTTVLPAQPPVPPKRWGNEKIQRAFATITP